MYNRINNSFILAVIGFLIIVVSLLLKIIIFPVIVDNKVRDAVILENGTEAIQRWQNPPPLDFNVYFFNVTNPLEVHVGAKPIVQEVGPFVYTEYHDKKIIKFHDEDDTVSYNITKKFVFNQEKSKDLLETDKVTLLNPALMGTVLMVQKLFPFGLTYINEAIPYLFPQQKTIFATATVHEFLFGGVLINCSHKSGPGRLVCDGIKGRTPVTVQQLPHSPNYVYSFFAHKNATTVGPYRVKRGRNDVSQIGQIQEFEEKEALTVWGANNSCNTIRGTDSTVFPPFLKKTDMIYIFIPDVCGSMFAEFSANMEVDNIETLKFVGSRKNFADPKKYPQNQCHCEEAGSDEDGSFEIDGVAMTCPKEGAMFLTECYKAPVVLSQPHFYLADKEYIDFPQGLSPNETKHETYLLIEPRTGTPVEGYKRLQMNMLLDIVPNIDILEHVSSGLMPILWVEEGFTLNEEPLSLLKSFYKVLSVLYYIPWFLILSGLALYLIAILISDNPKNAFCCFLNTARRVENMQNHVAESGIYYTDSIKSSVPDPPVTDASKDTPLFTSLTEYRNYYSGGSNNK